MHENDFSPLANGVTNEEIDFAEKRFLGDLVNDVEHTWKACGPPPFESYALHISQAFGIGFGAGFRRARIDTTFESR